MHPGDRLFLRGFVQRSILPAVCMLLGVALPALGLNVGDSAPNVHAQAAIDGKTAEFDLHRALAKSAVVLYFFPKAFTQG